MALLKANYIIGINCDFKTYIYVIRQSGGPYWEKMCLTYCTKQEAEGGTQDRGHNFSQYGPGPKLVNNGFCFAIYSSNGQIEQVDLQRLTESVFDVGLKTFGWICCGLKLKSNKFEQSWLFMNIRGHHMASSRFLINDMVFTIAKLIWIARN